MSLRFSASDGYVDLDVIGYEFASSEERYDANWLQVSARYKTRNGQAVVSDSALLTWELTSICETLLSKQPGELSLEFIEPEMSFSNDLESGKAYILLRYNLAPPWLRPEERKAGVRFYFEPSYKEWIKRHVTELGKLCSNYPERT